MSLAEGADVLIVPAPTLAKPATRKAILRRLKRGQPCIAYLQDKLGGEVSVPRSSRSPEMSFDVTMVELRNVEGRPSVGQFGILEVQTMDFHGSYRAVVKNLQDALRLHKAEFHSALQRNPQWLSEGIEGPNIANVFKRTFYQMMVKFQIGSSGACAGCVLAVSQSVWDSWQRHLGGPELIEGPDGFTLLRKPGRSAEKHRSWIFVFDIEAGGSSAAPGLIVLKKVIGTTAEAIGYYALEVAPDAAVAKDGPVSLVPLQIELRLAKFWPEIVRKGQ